MAKIKMGFRKPKIKSSIKMRTVGKVKRRVKKSLIPGYGKRGSGWVRNPKKAARNWVYSRTTIGVGGILAWIFKDKKSKKKDAAPEPNQIQTKAVTSKPVQKANRRRFPVSIKLKDMPTSYSVVDIETTGLDASTDSIIEISAIRVIDGKETDSFSTLIACNRRIPQAASAINGITNDMLKGAPELDKAFNNFIEFIGNDMLLGHNVEKFDRLFIERDIERLGLQPLSNAWLDTVIMARKIYPGERVRLQDLCQKFDIKNETAHRALSDCRATSLCYLAMRQDVLSETIEAAAFAPTGGKPIDSKLEGHSIVFTGESDIFSRHDLMQMAVNHSAKVQDRTTLKTTIVVNAEETETKKVKKALEYQARTGVRIIRLEDYLAMIGVDPSEQIASVSEQEEQAAYDLVVQDEDQPEPVAYWNGTMMFLSFFFGFLGLIFLLIGFVFNINLEIILGSISLVACIWAFAKSRPNQDKRQLDNSVGELGDI